MIDRRFSVHLVLFAVVMGIVAIVMFEVATVATAPETQAHFAASEAWCDDRGGLLVDVQSVYKGGLHCQFENGTMVRMAGVGLNETADVE